MLKKYKYLPKQKKSLNGFTLIEVLITLAIIAILLSITHVGFYSLSAKAEAKALIQELSSAVRFARIQALYQQQNTVLCPFNNDKNNTSCGTDWLKGFVIFQDNNLDNKLDPTDKILYLQNKTIERGTLTWNALHNYLSFSPNGISNGNAGSFIYCPENKDPNYAHSLIISFSGKTRLGIDQNHDGIKESGNQQNIECS